MRKRVLSLLIAILALSLLVTSVAFAYNEAPMLRDRVLRKELPPVNERLPENPQVVPVIERIGDYGGTLDTSSIASDSLLGPHNIVMGEAMLRTDSDYSTVVPNVAESWELSEDAKSLTLRLRKGIKWSDGVPFTANDLLFWWEDVELNPEIRPSGPNRRVWQPGGEPMKLTKIDDYTVRLDFARPHPLIIRHLAHDQGMSMLNFPKHYLKKFHPKYTPMEELEKMVAADDAYDYWYQMFLDKARADFGVAMNPECPTLDAFMVVEKQPGMIRLERNPYYWKVDAEGNQLPYIDGIRVHKASNVTTVNSKIMDEFGSTIMLITHDLGVIGEMADEVVVMYTGKVVEYADARTIFHHPLHPYTQGLLRSIPLVGTRGRKKLTPISGSLPDPYELPAGCAFAPRCPYAIEKCQIEPSVVEVEEGHGVKCWLYAEE